MSTTTALRRKPRKSQRDRRSEASHACRELIRETAILVHEQAYRYLEMPKVTRRILQQNEPVVERLVLITDAHLLTKPRLWVKNLLATLEAAMLVQITIEDVEGVNHLRLRGRWSDVQVCELVLQRTFLVLNRAATYAYRTSYREADSKRARGKVRGARKRWLNHYVTFLRSALGMIYERLAEQYGVDTLRTVVHNLEQAAIFPDEDAEQAALVPAARKAVAAASS